MTRKDFRVIADTLIECHGMISTGMITPGAVATVVGMLAGRLSDTYPNFDAAKFISYIGGKLEGKSE